jgi:hypothetical protein
MAQPQSDDGDDGQASRPTPCPKCGAQLRLVRIVPDEAQHEWHTAKCDACGEDVNSVVAIR